VEEKSFFGNPNDIKPGCTIVFSTVLTLHVNMYFNKEIAVTYFPALFQSCAV
jgi:hypothetical protein